MHPERLRMIEEAYHAALAQEPEARTAFLDKTCGSDLQLRREVECLIEEAQHTADFMEPQNGLQAGQMLNHYRVGALMGTGGMAEVYRARDTRLDRDVAIKVLQTARFLDQQGLDRLHREARILASLNHPNIAAVYGLEETDDICALVLELVDGETLSERIARGPLAVNETLDVAQQIVEGMGAAHAKDIIHRDLKPANIKIARNGTVKILDFGLAKLIPPQVEAGGAAQAALSTAGLVIGTLHYMSPEQARGKPIDTRTDIWAFGCVLFETLTGKPPFPGETPTDIIARIASEDPDWERLSILPAPISTKLQPLIRKCMQKRPEARYQSLREIAISLEAIRQGLDERHSSTPPEPPPEMEFALPGKFARPGFLLSQLGYTALYAAALFHVEDASQILAADFLMPASMGLAAIIVLAMCGIAVRIFLIASVGWRHPAAGKKFDRLFPVLLVLDSCWAASPLLLWRKIGYGIALAGVVLLAYAPFGQRNMMDSIYPRRVSERER